MEARVEAWSCTQRVPYPAKLTQLRERLLIFKYKISNLLLQFGFLRIVSKNMPVQMFVIFKDVSKLQAVC